MNATVCFHRNARAFTLVELLVVIAIIAILIGLLVPVLAGARLEARKVTELAACRQLMLGYSLYAVDYKGRLIPGHVADPIPMNDDQGKPLTPSEVSKRWPWRLAMHLKSGLNGSLLVNEQAWALAGRKAPLWSYSVSLTPSFGLNLYQLGGDLALASNAPDCLIKITQAHRASRMIVFCSARFPAPAGITAGYWKIIPPTRPSEYSATGWSPSTYQETGEPAAWGYTHLRFKGRAVAAMLDGHCETLDAADLRDMTRWSNDAARRGDRHWLGN